MSRAFSVAALAIAEGGANAVGAVRFTCTEAELEIELLRVAGYAEGFALGAVAEPVRFRVPYTAIRGLFRRGRALCVALDPSACTPYNRFALARFEGDAPFAPGETSPAAMESMAKAHRARVRAGLASLITPVPLGALLSALSPDELVSGPLGTASLALLIALATWLTLRFAAMSATWGGPPSDRLRDALEAELSRRMGFAPERRAAPALDPAAGARVPRGAPAGAPRDAPAEAPRGAPAGAPPGDPAAAPAPPRRADEPLDALPLRARVLVPVALAVAGIVGTMAFVQRFAAPRDVAPASMQARLTGGALRRASTALLAREREEHAELSLPRCLCHRADSPLWKQGVPILSLLGATGPNDGAGVIAPILRRGRAQRDGAGGSDGRATRPARGRYDFDLAAVNNGGAPLHDVRVVLTFARRDRRGERAGIRERGLFWEGELAPGRAVKWHVEAPGTEVTIAPSVTGVLGGATEPAEPDVFFRLTRARYRVVRIHAATMLAYLRDPRARDALDALLPPAPAEEVTFARIRRAMADVIPCSVVAEEGRLRACVFNGGVTPLSGAALREVTPPDGRAARAWPISATLPVHEGVEVTVPLEGGAAPEELEVALEGR